MPQESVPVLVSEAYKRLQPAVLQIPVSLAKQRYNKIQFILLLLLLSINIYESQTSKHKIRGKRKYNGSG